jgi:hypothetical protein
LLYLGCCLKQGLQAAATRCATVLKCAPVSSRTFAHSNLVRMCLDSNNTFAGPSKQAVTVVRCRRLLPSQVFTHTRLQQWNTRSCEISSHRSTKDRTNYTISANPISDQTLALVTEPKYVQQPLSLLRIVLTTSSMPAKAAESYGPLVVANPSKAEVE